MNMFTPEEISLICIYNPGNRAGTIAELRDMMRYLMPDELELKQLTQGVIKKLEKMSDSAFDALSDELIRMTIASFDCEDAARRNFCTDTHDEIDWDSEPE